MQLRLFSRTLPLKACGLLFFCCLAVYKLEDIFLNQTNEGYNLLKRPQPVFLPQDGKEVELAQEGLPGSSTSSNGSDIWISMALCWSDNAHYWGKDQFPYREAAPLSSRLWIKVCRVKVLLQIVFSEPKPSPELEKYQEDLESYGVSVKLVPKSPDLECVLEAQLIRIVAYLLPEIEDDDIMVTADVDAFVMTRQLIAPLVALSDRSIWLYRYSYTALTGSTFMMPFIGARSRVWRSILNFKSYNPEMHTNIGQGLRGWIEDYGAFMHFGKDYTWEIDQHITSRAILASGLCSVPKDNKLWKDVNLTPREINDTTTCWHGGGIYEDCNNKLWMRNAMIRHVAGKCMWWHFYPDEKINKLEKKFKEILADQQESGVFNSLIRAARTFELNNFGRVFN